MLLSPSLFPLLLLQVRIWPGCVWCSAFGYRFVLISLLKIVLEEKGRHMRNPFELVLLARAKSRSWSPCCLNSYWNPERRWQQPHFIGEETETEEVKFSLASKWQSSNLRIIPLSSWATPYSVARTPLPASVCPISGPNQSLLLYLPIFPSDGKESCPERAVLASFLSLCSVFSDSNGSSLYIILTHVILGGELQIKSFTSYL